MKERPELEGIILAAGTASRAGDFKLGWDIAGKAVLQKCTENFLSFCERIIVVTGYEPERVRQLLRAYREVAFVHNPNYAEGMFTSVQTGFARTKADRILVTPGDIPLVREDVFHRLLATDADVAIPAYLKRKGHPVLVSSRVRSAILAADPKTTLKDVLNQFKPVVVPVACEGILLDIDTISDYNELKETHERNHP